VLSTFSYQNMELPGRALCKPAFFTDIISGKQPPIRRSELSSTVLSGHFTHVAHTAHRPRPTPGIGPNQSRACARSGPDNEEHRRRQHSDGPKPGTPGILDTSGPDKGKPQEPEHSDPSGGQAGAPSPGHGVPHEGAVSLVGEAAPTTALTCPTVPTSLQCR
jgi:hypothetical protein